MAEFGNCGTARIARLRGSAMKRAMNKAHNQTVLSELEPGDLIEFPRGLYSHWGVYIGVGVGCGGFTHVTLIIPLKSWCFTCTGNETIVHLTSVHSEDMKAASANLCCSGGSESYITEVRCDNFWDVVGNSRAKKNNKLDERYP
ncbi:hras-like suppressor 3 [Plakobranchus ocellatus]|uniref:Hras-like suppressor 3 n=1 Tax=Plakobranchus ocellatus TaxID=259542 RepID=A0AAV4DMI5_9GAST|nr:hras-like suppressor 3 [Plakobranchus ocellatus]